MRKREKQAKQYHDNGIELKKILDELIKTQTEVQGFLDQTYQDTRDDYFTYEINENNEKIVEDVNRIKEKIDSVSGDLSREATRLDDEEELLKRKDNNITVEENTTN